MESSNSIQIPQYQKGNAKLNLDQIVYQLHELTRVLCRVYK
jgi:hypothetical protein